MPSKVQSLSTGDTKTFGARPKRGVGADTPTYVDGFQEHTIKAPTCYTRPHDAGRFRPRVAHAAPERGASTVPVGYGRLRPLVNSAPLTPCRQVPQGVYIKHVVADKGRRCVAAWLCGCVAVWLCVCGCVSMSVCTCLCAGQAYAAPDSLHALSMPARTRAVLPGLAPTFVTAASAWGAGSSSEGPSLLRCLLRAWQASTGGTAGLGAGGPSARW